MALLRVARGEDATEVWGAKSAPDPTAAREFSFQMKLIGLCGKPRAGKNAVAEIAAELVPGTAIITFSDEIVAECAKLLSVDPATINADKEHYRPFMQWYGYDHKRNADENYWVRKIEAKLDEAEVAGAPLAVVCGVRAINEWVMVARRGGVVYEVVRGVNSGRRRWIMRARTRGSG